jgi:hypothetical protein
VPQPRHHPLTAIACAIAVCCLFGLTMAVVLPGTGPRGELLDWVFWVAIDIAAAALLLIIVQVSTRWHPERWKPRLAAKVAWVILALDGVLGGALVARAMLSPDVGKQPEPVANVQDPLDTKFFIPFFLGGWCIVSFALSWIGGWYQLGKSYRARDRPSGKRFSMRSGWVGIVGGRWIFTIYNSQDGLYLSRSWLFRPFHPPLFIPWSEIHDARPGRFLMSGMIVFDVGSPWVATLSLPRDVFEGRDLGL